MRLGWTIYAVFKPGQFEWVFYTSTKSWRGYIFTSVCLSVCVCVCVCVCVYVCVCVSVCLSDSEQNSSRTDVPIWTQFSLNGCLLHWLGPCWTWWPWVKGHSHSDVISIFLHNFLLSSLLSISALFCPIDMKFGISLLNASGRFVFECHKNQTDDDFIVTSIRFSPLNCICFIWNDGLLFCLYILFLQLRLWVYVL